MTPSKIADNGYISAASMPTEADMQLTFSLGPGGPGLVPKSGESLARIIICPAVLVGL